MEGVKMRIEDSTVVLNSEHFYSQQTTRRETMQFWTTNQMGGSGERASSELKLDSIDISEEAKQAYSKLKEELRKQTLSKGGELADEDQGKMLFHLSDRDKQRIQVLIKFLEALTGKEFKLKLSEEIPVSDAHMEQSGQEQETDRPNLGFHYHLEETYSEYESLSFSAQGMVRTADGAEISFDVQLNMSREFFSKKTLDIREGAALVDPLVINYDGPAAQFTDSTFEFDLNGDGEVEQIHHLKVGSGFLALDLNGDGIINDGSELFGPSTGDGFGELAAHDLDSNGWIDEADEVFQKLRLWNGDSQQLTLAQANVGAIYLGNTAAQFGLKNASNQLQGQSQTAGVFLREDGGAGVVQQVDLAV
jgi:hypothetical protein